MCCRRSESDGEHRKTEREERYQRNGGHPCDGSDQTHPGENAEHDQRCSFEVPVPVLDMKRDHTGQTVTRIRIVATVGNV